MDETKTAEETFEVEAGKKSVEIALCINKKHMCFFEEASVTPVILSIIVPGKEKKIDISKHIGSSGKITNKTDLADKTITYEVQITPPPDEAHYI